MSMYASYSGYGGGSGGGGVSSVTASTPLASSGGANPNITIQLADATHNGYLSSADWSTFNNKQSALTLGNLTDAGTDGIVITNGTGAIVGSGTSIAQHVADSTHNGYLSSVDWSTFNGKQSTITIGALDAQAANATGLALVSNVLSVQSADATHPGLVNNTSQTLSGIKTFSSDMIISSSSTTALTINSTSLIYDASGNRLGINGAAGSGSNLSINSDTSSSTQGVTNSGYGANDVTYRFRRARGTLASPTAAQLNDILGDVAFFGYGATGFGASSTGIIHCRAEENFTDSAKGTSLTISTTPVGSITRAVMAKFNSTGNTLLGTTTDNNTDKLQVNGSIVASNLSGTNTGDVTLGTANGLSLASQALSLQAADTTHTGALTSTDWNTFNNKQAGPLTGDVTTSGAAATIANLAVTNAKIANSTIDLTAKVTGALPIANAGTNITTYTTGDILYASATNVLSKLAIGSNGNYLKIVSGLPSWAASSYTPPVSEVWVTDSTNAAASYGSTNGLVRRFLTTTTNLGSDISYSDSATLGGIWTINATGVYSITYVDIFTGDSYMAIVRNGTQGNTVIQSITTATEAIAISHSGGNGDFGSVSVTANLSSGDTIWAQTSGGGIYGTASLRSFIGFRVVRLS